LEPIRIFANSTRYMSAEAPTKDLKEYSLIKPGNFYSMTNNEVLNSRYKVVEKIIDTDSTALFGLLKIWINKCLKTIY